MRFLYLITGLGVGGAETQVMALCERLAALGHEVLLVSLTDAASGFAVENGFHIRSLGMRKRIGSIASTYGQLRALIQEFAPHVVHSHMVHANLFARLLRLSSPIPKLICSAHSTNEGGAWRMLAYRLTDWLSDLNTNVSVAGVDAFVRAKASPAAKMVVVHNGIDTTRFALDAVARRVTRQQLKLFPQQRLILAVGRLVPAKDYPNLLQAFAMLCRHRDDLHLMIAGTGSEGPALQALAQQLPIAERVTFLGLRFDVPELMNGADVFVLSSAWEGFGLVVGEAMACQRVVVATDCGGVREVAGDAALLVPPRDSQALATVLHEALELEADAAQATGQAARRRIEQLFSLDQIVQQWLHLYEASDPPGHSGS